MTIKKLTTVFLTLILAFGILSYGQRPARTLEGLTGKVTDRTNKPLPGMTVFAQGPNLRRETITDIEGNYYLALTPGKYEIRAGTNCDQTSYHKDVEVENGKTTTLDLVGRRFIFDDKDVITYFETTYDRRPIIEEPCEAKVSRTVL
jgi:protocatechuate 3,4-dioxygenase beta subunit